MALASVTEEDAFAGLPDPADFGQLDTDLRLYFDDVYSLPAAERMVKLMRPFRPYRSVACWYLWRINEERPAAAAPPNVKKR